MDRRRFATLMNGLALTLPPRQPLEDAALEGYLIGLAGLDDAQLTRAVELALRECDFLPAPVELRRLARRRDPEALVKATDAKVLQLRSWQRGGTP
jgi:hypothetical protein